MALSEELAFALERSFLASEFLTWLWFRCEVEGGEFTGPHDTPVSLAIEDGLSMISWQDDALKATIRGGSPTLRPEAANALASGLLLKRARLIVAQGTREWLFTLDGETLDLLSVKVVDPDAEDEEPEDALADKLAAGEALRDIVDALYDTFLGVRLAADWERIEVPRLQAWVQDKLKAAFANVAA